MIKGFLAISISLVLVIGVWSQTTSDAPIDWAVYAVGDHNLSVDFPKLPIRFSQADPCNEKLTEHFTAYAEEVVYTLTVVKREKPKWQSTMCPSTSEFGEETLNARRAELKENGERLPTADASERWALKASGRSSKLWIVDDLKKDRWIELTVTGRGDLPKAEEFADSLTLSQGPGGIEVGSGSPQTLGDTGVDTSVVAPSPTPKVDGDAKEPKRDGSEPLMIISKVKAQYTDAARRNKERGNVTLRVTFLANGGIGSIQVIQGLKWGLTEQAIAAARKLVFLPQRLNGAAATTSRPVTFSFNIY
jgi:TonB family protein